MSVRICGAGRLESRTYASVCRLARDFAMFVRLRVSAVLVLSCLPGLGRAAESDAEQAAANRLAAIIDRHLAADWEARGIKPAAPADDAEFLRRVSLDL